MTYCYSHRSVSCSTLKNLAPNGMSFNPFPLWLKHQCRRERKLIRARDGGCLQGNSFFWTQQSCHTHRLIGTVTTHTKPAWLQTRQIPALEKTDRNKVPSLAMKLFAIDICWKNGISVFSNGVSLGISARQTLYPGVAGEHKTDYVAFVLVSFFGGGASLLVPFSFWCVCLLSIF